MDRLLTMLKTVMMTVAQCGYRASLAARTINSLAAIGPVASDWIGAPPGLLKLRAGLLRAAGPKRDAQQVEY